MPPPKEPYQPYRARFLDPNGPGDSRPTADEIVRDYNAQGKWAGKAMLLTGGTGGLGLEIAKSLAPTGVSIFVTARTEEKGKSAVAEISKVANESQVVDYLVMDNDVLESVHQAVDVFLKKSARLDLLITNAGIMATPFGRTKDGFERQLSCNHLAHFLLFQLLQPMLSASATETPSRVIAISSGGHRFGSVRFDDINYERTDEYDPLKAYGQSKTANIYMCNYIDRHFAPAIHALSVHPGVILDTGITRHFDEDTLKNSGDLDHFAKTGFNSAQGAATAVWAALEPVYDSRGGVYLAEVGEAREAVEGDPSNSPVYASHAYDEAAEERLWQMSRKMVGLSTSE